ncbi:MAG: hypothetical protein MUC29_11535, partial [Pyrinomonadaceae bacterium]|jgi:hypothetical protein|nr:hypothetical protein [Pyrinomonadaceae bacterium]
MKSVISGQWLVVRKGLFYLLPFAFLLCTACVTGSMPNLDEPECEASRSIVKKFYSYHFGNDMLFSQVNLKQREKFLTPEFYQSLQNLQTKNDVFTSNSSDIPRAFRLGDCKVLEPNKTNVEVLLLWKDDVRSEQKIVNAEVVKQGDNWLINKILN